MARYVPAPAPTTADIGQLERWLREEYEQVARATDDIYELANFLIDNFTVAGYGGIGQNAATAALPDITAGNYITINTLDVELVQPRGIFHDLPNNGMAVAVPGMFYITVKLALEHNESNAGRRINMRMYNFTKDEPSAVVFRFGVGRNVGVTNLSLAVFFEIPVDKIGDVWQIQVGSDNDSFTSLNSLGVIYQMHSMSEWRGENPVEAEGASKWQ